MGDVQRVQKIQNVGEGIVHSVVSMSKNWYGYYFSTRCCNTLMDEDTKKGYSDTSERNAAYAPTQRPVTCKTCLRELHKELLEKGELMATTGFQQYVAKEVETGELYMSPSLDELLVSLTEDHGDEDLVKAIEKGNFTFYRSTEVNLKIDIKVIKKITGLSER